MHDQPPRVVAELLEPGRACARRHEGQHCCHHWSAPFTRDAAPGRGEVGEDTATGGVRGHPDRVVGQVGARLGRQGHRPAVTGQGDHRARARRTRRARPGRPAYGRWRGGTSRRPGASRCRASASRSRGRVSRRRAQRGAVSAASGRVARSPSQGPISVIWRRASAVVRKPSGRPSSSAIPARTRTSGRALGLVKTASKVRGRPSQLTNMPALSVTAATGNTTSAAAGHVGLAELEGDHEARGVERRRGRPPGRLVSSGSTPPTTRPPSSPEASAATIASPSRPACSGRVSTPQVVAASTRAAGVGRPGDHRAAGVGRQPVSTAPRSPARRGTQASLAPLVCGQRGDGGESAGHGGHALADQDHPARCRARRRRRGPAPRRPAASVPGEVGDQGAAHLAQAVGGERRDRPDPRAVLALGLAQPQEDRAGLVLGLEPDQERRSWRSRGRRTSHLGAARPRRRGTPPPRPSAGRARKSMSLVPSATRANLL